MTKEQEEYNRLLKKAYGKEAMDICAKCIAKCCSTLPGSVYITFKDIVRFKSYKVRVELVDLLKTNKTYLGRMGVEGNMCQFYQNTKGKSCKIYNARPEACRKFSPMFCGMYQEEDK